MQCQVFSSDSHTKTRRNLTSFWKSLSMICWRALSTIRSITLRNDAFFPRIVYFVFLFLSGCWMVVVGPPMVFCLLFFSLTCCARCAARCSAFWAARASFSASLAAYARFSSKFRASSAALRPDTWKATMSSIPQSMKKKGRRISYSTFENR